LDLTKTIIGNYGSISSSVGFVLAN